MSNINHRRFQNTSTNLHDILEHWNDNLSVAEKDAKEEIVLLAIDIIVNEGGTVEGLCN